MSNVSEEFFAAFTTNISGSMGECDCGKFCIDDANEYDYEWQENELPAFEANHKALGDKSHYLFLDHSVQRYEIAGLLFVYGCTCEGGRNIETLIRRNTAQIATFLNTLAKQHRAKADAMEVHAV